MSIHANSIIDLKKRISACFRFFSPFKSRQLLVVLGFDFVNAWKSVLSLEDQKQECFAYMLDVPEKDETSFSVSYDEFSV